MNHNSNSNRQTHLVGVIGWPIEHSLSPTMHNAVLEKLGLNWRYVAMPVRPGEVEVAVRGLAALGFRGCNVTVPHKQTVIPLLDEIAPAAAAVGAVNTLVFTHDATGASRITGHNTDVAGFIGALREGDFEPQGRHIVIVGAGGAARGIVYGLLAAGAAQITVLNRTWTRAERLVADLTAPPTVTLATLALTPATLIESTRTADLLINTTALGMWPKVTGCIWPADVPLPASLTVYDLVYNPLETRLLRLARQFGARAIDGLGMLARQGTLALDLWVDQALNVAEITRLMRKVCAEKLN